MCKWLLDDSGRTIAQKKDRIESVIAANLYLLILRRIYIFYLFPANVLIFDAIDTDIFIDTTFQQCTFCSSSGMHYLA